MTLAERYPLMHFGQPVRVKRGVPIDVDRGTGVVVGIRPDHEGRRHYSVAWGRIVAGPFTCDTLEPA